LVSWIARTTDSNYAGKDKYINCPRTDMAKTFWPYVPPYEKDVILVEGILDCMAVRRIPKTSAYACFGKHLSFTQTMILKSWGVESVTIFFDKDVPKKDIIKLVNELKSCFKDVYVLWQTELNKDLDAGDCLKLENGTAIIESVLKNRVHHDSLEYVSWQIKY
jgi:DNA primase